MTSTCVDMGQLIRSVIRQHCQSAETADPDLFVDFENAQPTEMEQELYILVDNALQQANSILECVASYGEGASKYIREAINNPSNDAVQLEAWHVLLPRVLMLKKYYDFSLMMGNLVPALLWELCSGPLPPIDALESRQALAKQFAQLLDFVLRFDELKMGTPAMQNDFSYYRRTIAKNSLKMDQIQHVLEGCVNFEEANTLSLFYAQATPMLNALTHVTQHFVNEHPDLPVQNTTDTLGTMANVCRSMIDTPEFVDRFEQSDRTLLFCARVMVGSAILYDYIQPNGVFAKTSTVNMKAIVRTLKHQPPEKTGTLLNALRYTSKHLNDQSTPKSIKLLLEV